MAFVSTFTPIVSSQSSSFLSTPTTTTTSTRRIRHSPPQTPCPSKYSARPYTRMPRASAEPAETPSASAPASELDAGNIASSSYDTDSPREVILDENIVGFCSIDSSSGKRLELSFREKEDLFLDAMQSFFRGKSILSNEEFDMLKEELTWQGSEVVTLSRDEFRFLDAARAYEQGKATIDDKEFDQLKKKLFEQGSIVAIARGPRCSIQRQITFSDVIPDKKRTLALFLPAGIVFGLAWLSLAFELTPLHKIDPVISLIIGSPVIFVVAKVITNIIVPRAEIMVGDCPSCGRRTHVLFGDVLNQKGFNSEADVKCDKCKAELKVERDSCRMILMKEGS